MAKRIYLELSGLTGSVPVGFKAIGLNDNGDLSIKNQDGTTTGVGGAFTHYIGEEYLGGVIFHLYLENGVEKGLIARSTNVSGFSLSNSTNYVGATSSWDGQTNTGLYDAGFSSLLTGYINGLTPSSTWYVPSIDELMMIYNNRFDLNKKLSTISGANLLVTSTGNAGTYLSSTESDLATLGVYVFTLSFSTGAVASTAKSQGGLRTIAVRKF